MKGQASNFGATDQTGWCSSPLSGRGLPLYVFSYVNICNAFLLSVIRLSLSGSCVHPSVFFASFVFRSILMQKEALPAEEVVGDRANVRPCPLDTPSDAKCSTPPILIRFKHDYP